MSMHTFVSITTTVGYICHKLTIMLLFCPFHSDDAFCALLPEVKTTQQEMLLGKRLITKKPVYGTSYDGRALPDKDFTNLICLHGT